MSDKSKSRRTRVASTIFYVALGAALFFILNDLNGMELWPYNLLVTGLIFLTIYLLGCSWFRHPEPIPDAPSHVHQYRLHYVGDTYGWEIICPVCHQRWRLGDTDRFFIKVAIAFLLILFFLLILYLPEVPEPYELLLFVLSMLPAHLITHSLTWLLLWKTDLSRHIDWGLDHAPEEILKARTGTDAENDHM